MKRFREWLIPELRREPDEARIRSAFRHAIKLCWTDWCVGICIFASLSGLYWPITTSRTDPTGDLIYYLANIGITLLTIFIGVTFCLGLIQASIRRKAREYLRGHGLPVCVPCGHELSDNSSGVCPECGAKIAPASLAKT